MRGDGVVGGAVGGATETIDPYDLWICRRPGQNAKGFLYTSRESKVMSKKYLS